MKKLLILIPLLISVCFAFAQASEYTFVQSTETYTEITGGTVLTTGTTDDVQYAITPPFAFTFAGTPVTAMAMSTNGYVSFNAGTNSFGYAAISATTAGAGVIAPLSRDLRGGTTGEMRWEVFGVAPNRYAVFQWKNWKDYNGNAANSWNFQVFIYETTNNVAIRYGSFTWADTYTNSYQIGLRGATNADFKNRSTTTDWSNTIGGSANNATCLVSTSVFPATGLQFAFNYPVASGPPNAPVLAAPPNGSWSLTNATLSWISGGGMPDTYDVYLDTVNPPVNIVSNNQTGTTYAATLAPGSTYYWKVVAANGFGDGPSSDVWSIQTPAADQLAESFEATAFPPAGWANPGAWSRSTSYARHGSASAYKFGSTSTQSILSTPRVTITGSSIFSIWSLVSNTTGTLQVVYSPDRTTWTQIGANITHAATFTWYNTIVDLSSLAGNNYYLGVRTGLQAVSYYTDLYIGPAITPEAPGAPALTAPLDAAVNVNEYTTFTWTAPITGGVPTAYNLYLDTVDGSTLYATGVNSPYTLATPLAYITPYFWTVAAYNGAGTGPQAAVRSFTTRNDPTISTFPHTQDFGTTGATFPPTNWTKHSGVLANPTVLGAPGTGSWNQRNWRNITATPVNFAAVINIYSSLNGWLISPPFAVPGDDYELRFDLSLNDYFTSNSIYDDPNGPTGTDDVFAVLIGDGTSWTPANVVRQWDNAGSAYVYNNISHLGEVVTLPLGSAGTKYIAFYGISTVSNADNDLFVDNVQVRQTPTLPILSYTPSSIDFGSVLQNVTTAPQNVTITNTGGSTLNIAAGDISISGPQSAMFSFDDSNLPAALTVGQSVVIPVSVTVTQEGPVSATLTITNSQTRTNYDVALAATGLPAGTLLYNLGNIPTMYVTAAPTTASRSDQPGELSFTVPAGHRITGVDISYSMLATNGAWMGEQRSFLVCPTNGETEPQVYSGVGSSTGTYAYNRTGLTLANNLTGTVVFELHAFRTWGNTAPNDATNDYYNYVVNGTWMLIVYTAEIPVGGPGAPILTSPADEATGLPKNGFNLQWQLNPAGTNPDRYFVYLADNPTDILDSEFYWETVNTTFNPITEGAFEYYYEDVWYWTVKAVNVHGEATATPFSFEIESDPTVTTFPWNEDFEGASFPPSGWTTVDVDGANTFWASSTSYNHTPGGAKSAKHGYGPQGVPQDGWMITPPVIVPTGNYILSWWNYNVWPSDMDYNGVLVNTTNDPADPNWVELWSPATVAAAWSQAAVNISAYGGQTVYFGFNYAGTFADDWFVDDVKIEELLVDTFGPTITHLPLINTPREDIDYLVYAEIVDDATWNNPIGGANILYSTDGGTNWSAPIPMTPGTAPAYTGFIPAQALGTTVTYKIEAWDNLNNMSSTNNFAFGVDDPTWIWYDQGGTTWTWFGADQPFSPLVLFENPFYMTGNAVQLIGVDGLAYDVAASTQVLANLNVYTWDGVGGFANFVSVLGPTPVVFNHTAYHTFDLTAANLQITTPYFAVSYDLPVNAAFLYDNTYNYGTTFVVIDGTLYTMSNPGAWCIGANVQTGQSMALDAPVVSIATGVGGIDLSWDAITGANSYQVFGSPDPYAADPWTLLGTVATPGYTYTGTADNQFFKVVSDSATRNMSITAATGSNPINLNVRSIKGRSAVKATINRNIKN